MNGRIKVKLIGQNANIYHLVSLCVKRMREEGLSRAQIDQFQLEVFRMETYDGALFVIQTWFDVE